MTSGFKYALDFSTPACELVASIVRSDTDIVVLGSFALDELRLVSEKDTVRVTSVDLEGSDTPFGFGSLQHHKRDIFKCAELDGMTCCADIVVGRWFFHHLTLSQKEHVLSMMDRLLRAAGSGIIIDWFVPEWDGPWGCDTHRKAIDIYYNYQRDVGLGETHIGKRTMLFDAIDKPNFRGGKLMSRERFEGLLEKAGFTFTRTVLKHQGIDDQLLFGHTAYEIRRLEDT